MRIHFVDDVFRVPYDALEEMGVQELLFDYDGTLVQRMSDLPAIDVIELLVQLSERFHVRVFSNNRFRWRRRIEYFAQHGIAYVRTSKPFGREAIADRSVLIGDKFLTDGLYALRRDIPCFLVRKRLSFLVEKLF